MNLSRAFAEKVLSSHSTVKHLLQPLAILQSSLYSTSSSPRKPKYSKKPAESVVSASIPESKVQNVEIPSKPNLPEEKIISSFKKDLPRPTEIPWQAKIVNSVNIIGSVLMPVQFQESPDGKCWAGTVLTRKNVKYSNTLWIPIIFEGDLAHVALCHLKEKDLVHVAGELSGDPPQVSNQHGQPSIQEFVYHVDVCTSLCLTPQANEVQHIRSIHDLILGKIIEVMVHSINFVQEGKERYTTYKKDEEAEKERYTAYKKDEEAEKERYTPYKKDEEAEKKSYTAYKKDEKTEKERYTPYKKDEEAEKERYTPYKKDEETEKERYTPYKKDEGAVNVSANTVRSKESVDTSWRDLINNPDKWSDYREKKLNKMVNPRYPDFKHRDSGQALWLSSAPKWALPGVQILDNKGNKDDIDGEYWKDLVENPSQWWDNRPSKFNERSPDFKHKDTGKVLWLSDSPAWVGAKLPPLKPKVDSFRKTDTLLS